ncbi:MAG: TonB-dependent receptor [Opitutus sp.]|nr:TonB-dependent receptor [Opitutus sp.]
MNKSVTKYLLSCLFAVSSLLAPKVSAQGITSSALSGYVAESGGKAIAGASIVVMHEPTGTRATTESRANGQFNLSGLRVGGPYTVTVTSSSYRTETRSDVYLDLGVAQELSFSLSSEVVKLDAFKVTAERDLTFGASKIGTGTSYDSIQIAEVATVRRNVQDVAALDSRLALMSLDQGGQLSAQGQNFRFNSFLVDGVQAVDSFGLNSNGFSSLRSPIPLESIESLSVELSPYDVRRAGFTGALLNAVTKSGTNTFHGSTSFEFTNQDMRAKNPVTQVKDTFKERTFNYALRGPIIKNILFFAINYDDFKRTAAPPAANFVPDAAVLATVVARAKTLGYDAGTLDANNTATQRTVLAKLDWNIMDGQRFTFTYRKNHGHDTSFAGFSGGTSTTTSNYWFQQPRLTDSYTGQLISNWSPNFRTEANISSTKFDGSPANNGQPFPDVTVNGVTGKRLDTGATATGSVEFGTELSRQLNFIFTKELNANIVAEYTFGDHLLTAGAEQITTKYTNKFLQRYYGLYTFASPTTWNAGTPPTAYQLAAVNPGYTLNNVFAQWKYEALGLFIQDTWKPTRQLTLLGGIRLDYPTIGQAPPVAPGFLAAFGIANNTTNDGNYTVGPRTGFIYELKTERKTQIRGGVGLFQGKNPAVWISNAYSNAGAANNVVASAAQLATVTFQPDVTKQPVFPASVPTPNINVTDPDFVQPAVWKANLAMDHRLPGGLVLTAEYYYLKNYKSPNVVYLNYLESTGATGPNTMPDGRIHYAGTITPTGTFAVGGVTTAFPGTSTGGRRRVPTFGDVFKLNNSSQGSGTGVTLGLARPFKDGWAASASWTHSHNTEVSPLTSSVASSNYSNRASFNPNEDVASISNTNIPNRIVGTLTRQFKFIQGAPTMVSLVYQGRTGHAYSWIFRGDANGDGFSFNDLFYVPTGPADPKVSWTSTTERDAFFAYVANSGLQKYTGGHPGRNTETSPWTNTLDIKITQQIPLPYTNRVKAEAFLNFINLANYADDAYGLQSEVPFSYKRAVAGATYNAAANGGAGQWIYTFNPTTLDGTPTTANDTPISRWQIQAGMRFKF